MKHYVFRGVLFTLGKDYHSEVTGLHLMYVNCQWQNNNNEVCDVDILVLKDYIPKAFDGDLEAREFVYGSLANYLLLSFNPSIIS